MRSSPRIFAPVAWKAHQPTPLTFSNSMLLRVAENQDCGSGDEQGPPSWTRSRTKRKLQDVVVNSVSTKPKLAIENPKSNDVSADHGQPPVLKVKRSPKHDDHVTCPDLGQPSAPSHVPWMPEKHILEHVLDIPQRRDTYEIFAEPVDPSEDEDYYEIIKEPMDFGTMRVKLREGMYTNLEQFEMRWRCIKNFQDDAKGFNLCTGLVKSVGSSSMTIDAVSKGTKPSLSGPSNFRRTIQVNHRFPSNNTEVHNRDYDDFSGAEDAGHTSLIEADWRCIHKHCMSYTVDNSIVSMIYGDPKPLILDISYRESFLFVKNLGPTAQMIAKQKLQGRWQDAPFCQAPCSNSWA